MTDELLAISQAAGYLQLSDKTVRRLVNSGKLLAAKVGGRFWRIKASDIEQYLKNHANRKKGVESK